MAKEWECMECGYVHEGPRPPKRCPECGGAAEDFELYEFEEDEDAEDEDWEEEEEEEEEDWEEDEDGD